MRWRFLPIIAAALGAAFPLPGLALAQAGGDTAPSSLILPFQAPSGQFVNGMDGTGKFLTATPGGGGGGCTPPGTANALLADNASGGCGDSSVTDDGTTVATPEPLALSYTAAPAINGGTDATSGLSFIAGLPTLVDGPDGVVVQVGGQGLYSNTPGLLVTGSIGYPGIILSPTGTTTGAAYVEIDGFGESNGPGLNWGFWRGTPDAPTAPQSGDKLWTESTLAVVYLYSNAVANWPGTNHGPVDLHFATISIDIPDTTTDRLVIDGNGNTNIENGTLVAGNSADAACPLETAGNACATNIYVTTGETLLETETAGGPDYTSGGLALYGVGTTHYPGITIGSLATEPSSAVFEMDSFDQDGQQVFATATGTGASPTALSAGSNIAEIDYDAYTGTPGIYTNVANVFVGKGNNPASADPGGSYAICVALDGGGSACSTATPSHAFGALFQMFNDGTISLNAGQAAGTAAGGNDNGGATIIQAQGGWGGGGVGGDLMLLAGATGGGGQGNLYLNPKSAANCTGQPSGSVISTTGTGVLVLCP